MNMKKKYMMPKVDDVLILSENILIDASADTKRAGSSALIKEQRETSWDNIWGDK